MKNGILVLAATATLVAGALAWLLFGAGNSGDSSGAAKRADRDPEATSIDRADTLTSVEARARAAREAVEIAQRAEPSAVAVDRQGRPIPTGPYHGRLLDTLGRPMASIEVELQSWADASNLNANAFAIGVNTKRRFETTNDEGYFTMKRRTSLGRTVGVTATARGFSADPIKVVLDAEDGLDLGDIYLEPAVIVEGWVRDGQERPVAGARVRRIERDGDAMVDVMDRLGFSGILGLATTDDDGRFELPHEKPGSIVLMVEHDDILAERFVGPTKRGGEVLQDLVIHVQRAGKIEGTVVGYPKGRKYGLVAAAPIEHTDEEDGPSGMSALLAARLSPAGDHTGDVEEDGSFVVSGLVPGARYRVRAISKKMFVQVDSLSEPEEAAANGDPITLQFDPGATVTFEAIDRVTRKPVENLTVSGRFGDEPALLQLSLTAEKPPTHFPKGKVSLYELRTGAGPKTLTLTIDAAGYFRQRNVEIEVPESGFVNAGKIEFDAAPTLDFRVVDAATRKPIKRARITLTPARIGLRSGATGTDAEEVLDEEQREQMEAAEAMMFGEYPERARGKTDRNGRCSLTALSNEPMILEIKARNFARYLDPAFVCPPEGGDIDIVLTGGGALKVFVHDINGEPVQDARVECRTDRGGKVTKTGETTEEDGVALFDHLPAGAHQIRAYRIERSTVMVIRTVDVEWSDVDIVRGVTQEVELEIPAVGDLRGVVTLGNGPAVDARVSAVEIDEADSAEARIKIQDELGGIGGRSFKTDLTDADGRFELPGLEPGMYAILVRHPEVAMVTRKDIEIGEGVTNVEVEIVMTVLEGRVVDDAGEPVAEARILVRRHREGAGTAQADFARSFLGASMSTVTTDASGRFKMIGVRAGTPLDVVVQADGYTDRISDPVTVEERETRSLPDIELQREGVIEVTYTGEDLATRPRFVMAKPVGGLAVESGAAEKVALMRAGRARLEGLVAGSWEVRTWIASGGEANEADTEPLQTIDVGPGQTVELEF